MSRRRGRFAAASVDGERWKVGGYQPLAPRLPPQAALVVRGAMPAAEAETLARRVLEVEERWTADFAGEQFSLGRAFYTHLETHRAREYFAQARASDALVEEVLPGLPARTLELLARLLGGQVRRRAGFCGPGVHVFPAGGNVARRGGVVHFDLEGLTEHQKEAGSAAVTLVWMLRPAERGGGLRLWDTLYDGTPDSQLEPDDYACVTVRSSAGDALLLDSRRLHQIRPFRGASPRLSVTVHAAEIDDDVWEAWF